MSWLRDVDSTSLIMTVVLALMGQLLYAGAQLPRL